jgi:hypothetical protein
MLTPLQHHKLTTALPSSCATAQNIFIVWWDLLLPMCPCAWLLTL